MSDQEPAHEIETVATAPLVALEGRGAWPIRWLRTIGQGLRPIHTAGSFARGGQLLAPLVFLLTTWLPLAFAQGIIPFTHTLRFGDRFGVERIGAATDAEVHFDLLRAGGISLLVQTAVLVVMLASFVSLCRAYGHVPPGAVEVDEPLRRFALRGVLYRAFWLPLGGNFGLLFGLVLWGLPLSVQPGFALELLLVISAGVPFVFAFVALRNIARRACGVGPLASLVVVIVPFVLAFLVEAVFLGDLHSGVLAPWLPTPSPPAPDVPVG
ncbi:MAG: hypothetical protein KF901_26435 [Myxococcales bacterium]|nr:hypothetical protein [Myxococcales bacterium]